MNDRYPGRPDYVGPTEGYFTLLHHHHDSFIEYSHNVMERAEFVKEVKDAKEIPLRLWAMVHLDPEDVSVLGRYDAARAKAPKTFEAAYAKARKTYRAACAEASKTLEAARAVARKTYDAACAKARKTFEAAYAEASKTFEAACAKALETCRAARAEAYDEAVGYLREKYLPGLKMTYGRGLDFEAGVPKGIEVNNE